MSTMPPLLSKKSAAPLPQEKTYYLKLCKLLVKVGRPVLQDVFDAIHLPTNLPGVLSTPKVQNELRQLQKKNVLYQSQMDILYPSSGGVSSTNFDISLLIILLRNICSIASPKWIRQPLPTDKSQVADIVRIRQCRNDLYHRTNLALTEGDFEKKWDEIKDALIRLGGGTKYEEDIQNIKVGSVDPEMEKHYHELLRSREEAETQQAEDINFIKTELKDVKQKLDESEPSVTIDIKTKFKLFAAGAVTIGWAAGCTYFLNRYKDDPEIVIDLVWHAIIPGTLAMGATVVGILRGSIIIKVKVTSIAALDYLWKSCIDGGEMEQNLHEVIVTEELIQQAPPGTDSVGISVTMSKDDYRRARDALLSDRCSSIPSHGKKDNNGKKICELVNLSCQFPSTEDDRLDLIAVDDTLMVDCLSSIPSNGKRECQNAECNHKKMRKNDETPQSVSTNKSRKANKALLWNESESNNYSWVLDKAIDYHERRLNKSKDLVKSYEEITACGSQGKTLGSPDDSCYNAIECHVRVPSMYKELVDSEDERTACWCLGLVKSYEEITACGSQGKTLGSPDESCYKYKVVVECIRRLEDDYSEKERPAFRRIAGNTFGSLDDSHITRPKKMITMERPAFRRRTGNTFGSLDDSHHKVKEADYRTELFQFSK
ncbi:E3 ubiquitin-protein ligase DZIP3 [Exaiptasia diaphana]|nr:E3 ubiquitin-protein ligase DZIP3 [Exaiptasia diaphana]